MIGPEIPELPQMGGWGKLKYVPLIIWQVGMMALFFVFAAYDGDNDADMKGYEDTHIMIFIGFGFLMTFLKKYSYSALGFNLLLAALSVQWALLFGNLIALEENQILISKKSLYEADVMAATVLISFGAVLGVASGPQLILMAFVEVAAGCGNLYLASAVFKSADIGGSMCIHAFGAAFGLGFSTALRAKIKDVPEPCRLDSPSSQGDVTAMIGSLFLWVYWPSFNSGLTSSTTEYQRAVINTYLSLASATVTTFILSTVLNHTRGKFDMVHIQNATLAGGVGVGSICNLFIQPGVAIAVGMGSAIISVLGYRYLTPKLAKIGVQDTCGVLNLHGLPAVLSGILSVLFAVLIDPYVYLTELPNIYPGILEDYRDPGMQAVYQLATLGVSVFGAFIVGGLTGLLARLKIFTPLEPVERHNDDVNWDLPKP